MLIASPEVKLFQIDEGAVKFLGGGGLWLLFSPSPVKKKEINMLLLPYFVLGDSKQAFNVQIYIE